SLYELYPLPFFNKEKLCTWDIRPTGNYGIDCDTGRSYAISFLRTCDGTVGWGVLISSIVADMIDAGTNGKRGNGRARVNGVVIGFMGTIGEALCALASPPTRGGAA